MNANYIVQKTTTVETTRVEKFHVLAYSIRDAKRKVGELDRGERVPDADCYQEEGSDDQDGLDTSAWVEVEETLHARKCRGGRQ